MKFFLVSILLFTLQITFSQQTAGDTGPGFDVQAVYGRFRTKEKYYSKAGNGIRLMARSRSFGILHDNSGTVFILVHLFDNGIEKFSSARDTIK